MTKKKRSKSSNHRKFSPLISKRITGQAYPHSQLEWKDPNGTNPHRSASRWLGATSLVVTLWSHSSVETGLANMALQVSGHSSTSRILHCLVPDFVWLGRKNTGNKRLSFFMPFTKSELPTSFTLIWTMHAGQRMKASQQLHNCLIHTATGFAQL